MGARGGRDRPPEKYCNHAEALAFIAEAQAWMTRTGTAWSHLCSMADVHASVRGSVEQRGNGMLRASRNALAEAMERYPDGILAADVGKPTHLLTQGDTIAFAAELQDWLNRTGTAPWRIAMAAGRTGKYLLAWLENPTRVSARVVARYRDLMAANPDGMGKPIYDRTVTVASLPPLVDPLAERRGEAERRRAEWVAQQAAEHQRKYGRPMGRAIEEMAA